MIYFSVRPRNERVALAKAYPGKVEFYGRYLVRCTECEDFFTSGRSDKKTCNSTCRQRQSRRLAKLPTTKRMF